MRLKRKNVARLASISALGAGALGVVAGSAEAGTIQFTALSGEIGFSATTKPLGSLSTLKVPVVPGITAYFKRSSFFTAPGGALKSGTVNLEGLVSPAISFAGGSINFQTGNAVAGQQWKYSGPASSGALDLLLGQRTSAGFHSGQNGTFYKLFAFATSYFAPYDWGWIELDETVSATAGPDVKILGIGYDTSGALIEAGAGAADAGATPEPSTAALASLSALALGATGLRRWRAARKQNA
jgi:hypothetical protein